jgi:hypothetical protein
MEATIDDQPIFLADPDTDNVSLVTTTPSADGAVAFTGTTALLSVQLDFGASPSAAAYVHVPNSATAVLVVAIGDQILPNINCPAFKPPSITLQDSAANPVMVAAVAGVKISSQMYDDLVVWGTNGKLYIYPTFAPTTVATYASACTGAAATLQAASETDTSFTPGTGAQLMIDNQLVIVAAEKAGTTSSANTQESLIAVYDVSSGTATLAGATLDRNDGIGLHAAVIQTYGGQGYVFAGFPQEPINSLTTGAVEVFAYDAANGIDSEQVQMLYDAQPDENELFGRSLAIMPYEGTNVLAVGASNEVFAYFEIVDKAGTPLYEDPRAN